MAEYFITELTKIRIHQDDLHLLINSDGKIDPVLPVKAALTYGPFVQENEAFALRLASGKVSTLKTAPKNARIIYKTANGEKLDINNPTFNDWLKFGTFLRSQKEKYSITSWDSQSRFLDDYDHNRLLMECSISGADEEAMVVVCCRGRLGYVDVFPAHRRHTYWDRVDPLQALSQCCHHQVVVEKCEPIPIPGRGHGIFYGTSTYNPSALYPLCPWSTTEDESDLFEYTYLYEDEVGNKAIASSCDDEGYQEAVAAGRQTRITVW